MFEYSKYLHDREYPDFELHAVIHFLTAKSMKSAEILYEISEIHGENISSDRVVTSCSLLLDDARPNMVNQTHHLIKSYIWEVLDQLSYSSDLMSNDYLLFLLLKFDLGSECHDNNNKVKMIMLQVTDFQISMSYWYKIRKQFVFEEFL